MKKIQIAYEILSEARRTRQLLEADKRKFNLVKAHMYSIFECYAHGIISWDQVRTRWHRSIKEYVSLFDFNEKEMLKESARMLDEYERVLSDYKPALDEYKRVHEQKMTSNIVIKKHINESVAQKQSHHYFNRRALKESELKDIAKLKTWKRVQEAYPNLTSKDCARVRLLTIFESPTLDTTQLINTVVSENPQPRMNMNTVRQDTQQTAVGNVNTRRERTGSTIGGMVGGAIGGLPGRAVGRDIGANIANQTRRFTQTQEGDYKKKKKVDEGSIAKASTDQLKRIVRQAEDEQVSAAFASQVRMARAELKKRGVSMRDLAKEAALTTSMRPQPRPTMPNSNVGSVERSPSGVMDGSTRGFDDPGFDFNPNFGHRDQSSHPENRGLSNYSGTNLAPSTSRRPQMRPNNESLSVEEALDLLNKIDNGQLDEGLGDFLGDIANNIGGAISGAVSGLGDNLRGAAQNLGRNLGNTAQSVMRDFTGGDRGGIGIDAINDIIRGNGGDLQQTAQNALSHFTNGGITRNALRAATSALTGGIAGLNPMQRALVGMALNTPAGQRSLQKIQGLFDSADLTEGYKVLPGIDRDRYPEIDGLEGPIVTLSGAIVYYDPKEGQYYDKDRDMYLSYDEFRELDNDYSGMKDERDITVKEAAAKIACLKCDEVSTAKAWQKNGGFCPKCKTSSQGVAESAITEGDIVDFNSYAGMYSDGAHASFFDRDGNMHTISATGDRPRKYYIDGEEVSWEDAKRIVGNQKLQPQQGMNEADTSYEKGMDNSKPVIVSGVKGMKSTPFRKKFKNMSAYEKWSDSEAAGDYEVHQVTNEGLGHIGAVQDMMRKERSASGRSSVTLDYSRYMRSHGKKPRDTGSAGLWMFTTTDYGDPSADDTFEFSGRFADAKRAAAKWAKSQGADRVYVMEDASPEEEDKFHRDLDKLVHKTFGHSSDEKEMRERKMSKSEKSKEKRLKDKYDDSGMKQSMKDQYGDDWEEVYFATIRKKAMEQFNEMTSAGGIAAVAQPLGKMQRRKTTNEKKKSPAGGPACWDGKKIHPTQPTKMKGGKRVNNCIDADSSDGK